jgi:hypothetical protein
MSFDGYGGDGHAFNEVWDRARNKWLFIDSFNSFFVTDPDGQPLSAAEIPPGVARRHFGRVAGRSDQSGEIRLQVGGPGARVLPPRSAALFPGVGQQRAVLRRSPAVKALSGVSRSAEQLVGIAVGMQPKLVIPRDFADPEGVAELMRLRVVMILFVLGAVVAGFALLLHRRGHR